MAVLDPHTRIERLLAGAEPRFVEELLAMLALVRGDTALRELADLIEAGDIDFALRNLRRAVGRLGVVWSQEFTRAGEAAADFVTRRVDGVIVDFDQSNTRATRIMAENRLRLIREFTEAQRRATREALVEGVRRGANPIEQARRFRDSIGLTQSQQRAVDNYQRALEELDGRALRRELRDRRFDPTVRRALANDEPLSRTQIDRMTNRYRERFLAHRAKVIARTEALRSVHAGTQELYSQAIESGELLPNQLQQEWNTAGDERVRDFAQGAQTSHRSMQGQTQPIGQAFISGAGNSLRFPGDPNAPGFETIQCRCAVGTRILSLDEVGPVSVTLLQV